MEDEENDVYIGSHKDLYATSFVDEEFLSTGLTKENALEYFRRSPFTPREISSSSREAIPRRAASSSKS